MWHDTIAVAVEDVTIEEWWPLFSVANELLCELPAATKQAYNGFDGIWDALENDSEWIDAEATSMPSDDWCPRTTPEGASRIRTDDDRSSERPTSARPCRTAAPRV